MKRLPRKRFGQNFLKDKRVIEAIITSFDPKADDHIIEIGPGLGALTAPLIPLAAHLHLIEIDRDLASDLTTTFMHTPIVTIHTCDALKFDFSTLHLPQNQAKKFRIMGNLPYNISTPLIFHLLKFMPLIADMHFMLQKEVVERLCATPNTPAFGRLSLMLQYYCKATPLFLVQPEAFFPKPKVQSQIVRLVPHETLPYPTHSLTRLREITTTAFNHRRKTLANALKSYFNADDFRQLNIIATKRPENFSLEDYVKMANFKQDVQV
jgi:16S rRNA (adenine1518-N6/adenine1519-N6)-dimethyltransferase